jgi:hypothetical protein
VQWYLLCDRVFVGLDLGLRQLSGFDQVTDTFFEAILPHGRHERVVAALT